MLPTSARMRQIFPIAWMMLNISKLFQMLRSILLSPNWRSWIFRIIERCFGQCAVCSKQAAPLSFLCYIHALKLLFMLLKSRPSWLIQMAQQLPTLFVATGAKAFGSQAARASAVIWVPTTAHFQLCSMICSQQDSCLRSSKNQSLKAVGCYHRFHKPYWSLLVYRRVLHDFSKCVLALFIL